MPFKWVQCFYCDHTMHINNFPPEAKKDAQRRGHSVCIQCLERQGVTLSRLRTHGQDFFRFIEECK